MDGMNEILKRNEFTRLFVTPFLSLTPFPIPTKLATQQYVMEWFAITFFMYCFEPLVLAMVFGSHFWFEPIHKYWHREIHQSPHHTEIVTSRSNDTFSQAFFFAAPHASLVRVHFVYGYDFFHCIIICGHRERDYTPFLWIWPGIKLNQMLMHTLRTYCIIRKSYTDWSVDKTRARRTARVRSKSRKKIRFNSCSVWTTLDPFNMLPDENIIRFSQRWRCRRLRIFFFFWFVQWLAWWAFFHKLQSIISVGSPPYATSTHAFPHHFRNDAIQWLKGHVNNNNHKNKIRNKKNGRPNDGGQFSCAAVMVTQLPGIISEYKIWWTQSLFGVRFSGYSMRKCIFTTCANQAFGTLWIAANDFNWTKWCAVCG